MPHLPTTRRTSPFTLNKGKLLLLTGAVALGALYFSPSASAEKATVLPAPSATVLAALQAPTRDRETVVFAGGCFWGVQAVFQHTKGVLNAVSGYAGGSQADADYDRVSSGTTGHAEAVQITFDPRQISYAQLMQIYFSIAHDPTQLNRQGPDSGTQYRSAIFFQDPTHKAAAERYVAQLDAAHVFPGKIVTQLNNLQGFYPAEGYHQNYATLHPDAPYIARFDLPKIANLQKLMPTAYRAQPVLVP